MPWVIKIGGSLYRSRYLGEWLNTLNGCSANHVVIVPGGGPFADQVRLAAQQHTLDQKLAHNMAVLGMQQFGYVMASLCPELCLADTREKIYACWQQAKAVIWEPYNMVQKHCKLENSWEVTSDSLAAWLADYLAASHLLLIKSAKMTLSETTVDELAKQGCIDSTLPALLAEMNMAVHFMHKSQVKEFRQRFNNDY